MKKYYDLQPLINEFEETKNGKYNLYDVVRELCIQNKKSQAELARELGITYIALFKGLKYKNLRLNRVVKIANIFNVDAADLIEIQLTKPKYIPNVKKGDS